MIHVSNATRFRIAAARVAAAARGALAAERAAHLDVSVAIVSDAEIHELNRRHLAHDWPTDVITFPLRDEGDPDALLGEVVVSADRARAEARARRIDPREELCRYVVHGCLHLLGYDDREPRAAARMRRRQEAILANLGR